MPRRVTTGPGFRINWGVRRATSAQIQGPVIHSAQGVGHILQPIVNRWKEEFNQRLPTTVNSIFRKRSGKLSSSKLVQGGPSAPGAGGAVGRSIGELGTGVGGAYHMYFSMTNVPPYGYPQEFGREDQKRKRSDGFYMVPVAADNGKEMTGANIKAILKSGQKRGKKEHPATKPWVPRAQWKNWGTDYKGRKVKYVFRTSDGRVVFAPGERRVGSKGRKGYTGGKQAQEAKIKELLFLAYPEDIPGIPGRRAGTFGKSELTARSPLVAKYGFTPGKAASGRWFQKHLSVMVPRLYQILHSQRTQRQIRTALTQSVGRSLRADVSWEAILTSEGLGLIK